MVASDTSGQVRVVRQRPGVSGFDRRVVAMFSSLRAEVHSRYGASWGPTGWFRWWAGGEMNCTREGTTLRVGTSGGPQGSKASSAEQSWGQYGADESEEVIQPVRSARCHPA